MEAAGLNWWNELHDTFGHYGHVFMTFLQNAMDHFGYLILSLGLMLEVLALPLPGEFLMSYAGLRIYEGQLNWPLSVLCAALGSSTGVTIAYWIGYKAGRPFFEKVGPKIHLGPDKLDKVSGWFERYGNKMLLIAYYIPGVRHFTGYFAGVTRLPFRTFAIYAYTGAFIWTGLFITLGKILGPQWENFHHAMGKYFLFAGILVALFLIVYYTVRKNRGRYKEASLRLIERGLATLHSARKLEWAVALSFLVCVAAVTWAIFIIDDLIHHELFEFDDLAPLVVHAVFDASWAPFMNELLRFAQPDFLGPVIIAAMLAIWMRQRDRWLAYAFFALGLVGGALGELLLRAIFARVGPLGDANTFPDESVIVTAIVFGLSAYFGGRAVRYGWLKITLSLAVLASCLLVGSAVVYTDRAYASDVSAALAFGGGWISMVVVLFEVSLLIKRYIGGRRGPA